MDNLQLLLLIIITAIITLLIRTMPLFVKINENNRIINKFFEALPYAVLTLLIFPSIFTSGGTANYDIVKVLIGIVIIAYLSLKKYGLGIIISVSLVLILLLDIIKVYLLKL